MKRFTARLTTLALTMALATVPLTACGGAGSSDAGADGADSAASQTAKVDTSSWKTMGDALATVTSDEISYSYNEKYFVCVFEADGARIRTVAEADPAIEGKFADLDFGMEDYAKKFTEIVADLKLVSAEDITAEQMGPEELDTFVGKTGQELVDAGFVFESYSFYGGEETGVTMGKGNFSYEVTFDTKVSEDQTEDEGAAIMGAKSTIVEGFGNLSNAALDPYLVK